MAVLIQDDAQLKALEEINQMLEELREYTGAPRTVLFGNKEGECDVVIPDAGGGNLVRELKKRFEPVSLRGWREMIHF